jgi:hypothetical protein
MLVAEVTHNRRRESQLTEEQGAGVVVSLRAGTSSYQVLGGEPGVVRRGAE